MRIFTCLMAFGLALAPSIAKSQSAAQSLQMIVTFSINDYAAWRPVFDAAAPQRAKFGVTDSRVYRDADSPNNLLVVFDVTNRKNANAWMTSAAVRADWEKGGVIGTPAYRFTQ